jgi:hypothetical protein
MCMCASIRPVADVRGCLIPKRLFTAMFQGQRRLRQSCICFNLPLARKIDFCQEIGFVAASTIASCCCGVVCGSTGRPLSYTCDTKLMSDACSKVRWTVRWDTVASQMHVDISGGVALCAPKLTFLGCRMFSAP